MTDEEFEILPCVGCLIDEIHNTCNRSSLATNIYVAARFLSDGAEMLENIFEFMQDIDEAEGFGDGEDFATEWGSNPAKDIATLSTLAERVTEMAENYMRIERSEMDTEHVVEDAMCNIDDALKRLLREHGK